MGENVFEASGLTRTFGDVHALRDVSLSLTGPSIIGLIGRNGSGKTTLLRHIVGLQLPSRGHARTFGVATGTLDHEQLTRIGVVPQNPSFVGWMSVGEQLRYLSRFYPRWDVTRQEDLMATLDLGGWAEVRGLSAGNLQKLAIVAALCHHPDLILLDEPVSNLDPIRRDHSLKRLLDIVQEDNATIVISSHVLHDIESTVDWVVCLNDGKVAASAALDDLKEQFAKWRVTTRTRELPARFDEPYILQQTAMKSGHTRLVVQTAACDLAVFRKNHDVDVEVAPLNLQGLFPVLVGNGSREFFACGLAAATLSSLILSVAASGGPAFSAVAWAAGVAGFFLAGSQFLMPEGSLLLMVGIVALFAVGHSAPAASVVSAAVTVALIASAPALWSAFGARSFRWASLSGPRRDGSALWNDWITIPWWPHRRRRRRGFDLPFRAGSAGTSILRGVYLRLEALRRDATPTCTLE